MNKPDMTTYREIILNESFLKLLEKQKLANSTFPPSCNIREEKMKNNIYDVIMQYSHNQSY